MPQGQLSSDFCCYRVQRVILCLLLLLLLLLLTCASPPQGV
jgi:hypothetical protein